MKISKILEDTIKFVFIPGRFMFDTAPTRHHYGEKKIVNMSPRAQIRGWCSALYAACAFVGIIHHTEQNIDTGAWTLAGQSQVRQERAEDVETLRSLVDDKPYGISFKEYNRFIETIGGERLNLDNSFERKIKSLEPDDVKEAIKKYRVAE